MNTDYVYRGWRITYDPLRQVTGTWRADRYGVGMCNNSEEFIRRMVDTKVEEKHHELQTRNQY